MIKKSTLDCSYFKFLLNILEREIEADVNQGEGSVYFRLSDNLELSNKQIGTLKDARENVLAKLDQLIFARFSTFEDIRVGNNQQTFPDHRAFNINDLISTARTAFSNELVTQDATRGITFSKEQKRTLLSRVTLDTQNLFLDALCAQNAAIGAMFSLQGDGAIKGDDIRDIAEHILSPDKFEINWQEFVTREKGSRYERGCDLDSIANFGKLLEAEKNWVKDIVREAGDMVSKRDIFDQEEYSKVNNAVMQEVLDHNKDISIAGFVHKHIADSIEDVQHNLGAGRFLDKFLPKSEVGKTHENIGRV